MKLYLTHDTNTARNKDFKPYDNPSDWKVVSGKRVHDYRDAAHDVIEVDVTDDGEVTAAVLVGLSQGPKG
jgi:hypothetical protein